MITGERGVCRVPRVGVRRINPENTGRRVAALSWRGPATSPRSLPPMTPAALTLAIALLAAEPAPAANPYFTIEVVDEQTGRGVPLVELKTVNAIRLFTDSHGIAAFREPGLEGESVFFHVQSHGYEFPKDGFGYRGKALTVRAGGSATIKVRRLNVAE